MKHFLTATLRTIEQGLIFFGCSIALLSIAGTAVVLRNPSISADVISVTIALPWVLFFAICRSLELAFRPRCMKRKAPETPLPRAMALIGGVGAFGIVSSITTLLSIPLYRALNLPWSMMQVALASGYLVMAGVLMIAIVLLYAKFDASKGH